MALENTIPGVPPLKRINGVVIGIVVDNNDPSGQYRVKVKFPWIKESDGKYSDEPDDESFVSTWARIASFMAGPDRGAFFLPEVDDEVLVAFEHGDLRRPFIIGSLWNGQDKSIHSNKSQGGQNNFRSIHSRSGHIVQFVDNHQGKERIVIQTKVKASETQNDAESRDGHFIVLEHTDGNEKIEIYDRTQKNYVLIDSTNNKITVQSKEGDILISAPQGKITIEAKELVTKTSAKTSVTANGAMSIQGHQTVDVKASSTMTIKGAQVKIN